MDNTFIYKEIRFSITTKLVNLVIDKINKSNNECDLKSVSQKELRDMIKFLEIELQQKISPRGNKEDLLNRITEYANVSLMNHCLQLCAPIEFRNNNKMTKNVNLVSKKKNLVPGRHYLLLKEESGDNFKVGKAKLFLQHDNEESFECHSNTFSTHLYAHIVVCEIFNYSKIVFPELDVEGFVENGITCWPLNKMVLLGEIQQTRDLPLIPSQRSVATSSSSDEESNATDESNSDSSNSFSKKRKKTMKDKYIEAMERSNKYKALYEKEKIEKEQLQEEVMKKTQELEENEKVKVQIIKLLNNVGTKNSEETTEKIEKNLFDSSIEINKDQWVKFKKMKRCQAIHQVVKWFEVPKKERTCTESAYKTKREEDKSKFWDPKEVYEILNFCEKYNHSFIEMRSQRDTNLSVHSADPSYKSFLEFVRHYCKK
jgi:hypothetical protein